MKKEIEARLKEWVKKYEVPGTSKKTLDELVTVMHDIVVESLPGDIMPSDTMILREAAGELTDDKGNKYEASIHLGGAMCPVVRSGKTGKWFVIPWKQIVNLAITKGIDKKE